jgi:hypothetical protein
MKRFTLIAAVLVLVLSPINAAADFTTCYPLASSYNTGSTDGTTKTRVSEIAGYNTEDGWARFDTLAIPDTHSISNIKFHFYVRSTFYPYWSVTPLTNDPLTASAATLFADINAEASSGYYNYRDEASTYAPGWKTLVLGGTARLDMEANLGDDWFGVGVACRDDNTSYYIVLDGWAETNVPYLVVEHTADACSDHLIDIGSMTCGDVLTYSGDTTGATNYCGYDSGDNFLMFEVLENGLYTLDMCWYTGTLFDTVLWLYDDECCGNPIAANDDDPNCGLKSRIDIVLSPGTYYAQVEGYGADEGLYRLDITCEQPVDLGPVPCFEEIVYDQDTSGAIDYCGHPSGDAHFKFTVDYTANYTVSLCNTWTTYNSFLRLFDDYSCGNQIAANNNYPGCGLNAFIDVTLAPGDYFAHVEGYNLSEGPFELHISCNEPDGDTELGLLPNLECYEADDTVYLAITLSNGNAMIVGGQFFLGYDNTALDFESITVGDAPFTNEVYNVVNEGAGTIDYAVGVPEGTSGTINDTVMAYLTFTALRDICSDDDLVHFRTHSPPTRLSDNYGNAEFAVLLDMDIDDTTPPVISCPGPLTLECDQPTDPPGTGAATATDNCDAAPVVTHSDAVDFSGCGGTTGTITRTWQAMDHCGNLATCDQVITVVDTTAPVVTAGAIDSCYASEAAAEAAAIAATGAADNCTPPGSLVYTPFTVGECSTVITVTVADLCGNSDAVTYNTRIDGLAPLVLAGANINVNADAGLCTAAVDWLPASAADNCDGNLAGAVVYHIDLGNDGSVEATQAGTGYIFPAGTHKVTATATDTCLNTGQDDFLVTVSGDNTMVVFLSHDGTVSSPLTRCITFELWDCGMPSSVMHKTEITFNGGAASASIDVPCGNYSCVTARDELHTLRRTADGIDFQIIGTQYVANFVDPLLGGNLNGDSFIDILDYGVFSWQFGPGGGSTNCSDVYPHADINGNSIVNSEDFSFIQINFLKSDDADCCSGPNPMGPADGPVLSISLSELRRLGLEELAIGDLNGDAVLDQADMAAFIQGARPGLKPKTKEGTALHE